MKKNLEIGSRVMIGSYKGKMSNLWQSFMGSLSKSATSWQFEMRFAVFRVE